MKTIITTLLILIPAIVSADYMVEYSTGSNCITHKKNGEHCKNHLKHLLIKKRLLTSCGDMFAFELHDGSEVFIKSPYIKIFEIKKPEKENDNVKINQ